MNLTWEARDIWAGRLITFDLVEPTHMIVEIGGIASITPDRFTWMNLRDGVTGKPASRESIAAELTEIHAYPIKRKSA